MSEPPQRDPAGSGPSVAVAGDAQPEPRPSAEYARSDDAIWEPRWQWWGKVPLRVKLVVGVLSLVTLALTIVGAASVVALQDYLLDRVDGQLATVEAELTGAAIRQQGGFLPSDFVVAQEAPGGTTNIYATLQLFTSPGQLPDIPADLSAWAPRIGDIFTVPSRDHHGSWRVLVSQHDDGRILVVAEDLADVEYALGRLILIDILVSVGTLILLGLASVWLVRISLRPLVAMEKTAAAIAGGDLARRVPALDRGTELGQLSAALNTMLTQIESAFRARAESERRAVSSEERMRQFVADASHELRTPLTTIRGFAELYRQGAAPDPGEVLSRIEDEAARMGLLVEDLLLLARLDQERPLRVAPVPLARLVDDAASAAQAIAPDRTIEVDVSPESDRLVVNGDEARLRQVLDNLVTNALTHTAPGTPVTLRLRPEGETHAVIEVADRGPGLTPEQSARVFERFYRVDKARTRRAASRGTGHTGTGLGLAIVAALTAAHSGTVEVDSVPGEGATFRVRLPLASEPA